MQHMFDFEIAFYLYKISKILAIFEDNKYKSKAYFKAAMAIDAYDDNICKLQNINILKNIDGIGDSSIKLIKEITSTGNCILLSELEKRYGIEDYSLILSYGLSNKIIKKMFELKICCFNQLLTDVNMLKSSQYFTKGEMKQIDVFISAYSKNKGKYLYSYAFCLGQELVEYINRSIGNNSAYNNIAWKNKTDRIEILCLNKDILSVKKLLENSDRYSDIKLLFNEISGNTRFGIPINIQFLDTIPHAQRLQPTVLRGDLHMHTTWSDGIHSILQMADTAIALGREYIGITDHTHSLRVANGLSELDAQRQIKEIHKIKNQKIKVLSGIEVEILQDGTLDYSDEILAQFDYVIAGIHTFLNQDQSQLEKRIEKALSNPYVSIFAHPSSRLLGRPGILFSERQEYSVSISTSIELCKKYHVALEFNCFPERFDVDATYFQKIHENGIKVSVGTDSHSAYHLNCINFAEQVINKYPVIKQDILNTMSADDLLKFFNAQRRMKNANVKLDNKKNLPDFSYFFGNNQDIMNGNIISIGIDLTGNESKPSGWAVLQGQTVITKMLYTDDDLIKESLKFNPKVVSIDSPLSHPYKEIGITRYCERLLSSFGIGVYPCLIPSMVSLTNRGMLLAKKFRDLGIEVIESYPGVAQDILGIRRKQNGLGHLKNGYKSFGLNGDFYESQTIKHDELDAIMSALVGLFYLNNEFVALGNEVENYLIVPKIAKKIKKQIIIGLAGEIGAGKTTLSEYLKFKYGFKVVRYSHIINQKYNCNMDRALLQKVGSLISNNLSDQMELSINIIKYINQNQDDCFVIDGLRHDIDYTTLKTEFGDNFILIYIDSTFSNRYKKYLKREQNSITIDEFSQLCSHNSERDVYSLRFISNVIINNDSTYKEFFNMVEMQLKEYICL